MIAEILDRRWLECHDAAEDRGWEYHGRPLEDEYGAVYAFRRGMDIVDFSRDALMSPEFTTWWRKHLDDLDGKIYR